MSASADTMHSELAHVVQEVPGVAFLAPGLRSRLRSLRATSPLARPGDDTPGITVSAVRGEPRTTVEIRLICRSGRRTLDTTRAVREAVSRHLATGYPGREFRIIVTVTGVT
ncbi:hypothetical protein C6W96_19445 [Streptomyces sp. CS149]|uniref:Asp23/Gls24 family envelope stress response protein n=1 Tax=Streptomyces parvus TaxID=66428 RepID=A0A5D4HW92_9ACTN|nr:MULTISPECIES: hypothetical protein [Streptomyces]MCC8479983.1 hypothetical protein [Streptomyces globisporus]MYV63196.1 hypothetical protein [Streptomyces sp. SID4931]SCG06868.1 hypothetical protein GA0115255_121985 [Streptomyces sp. Ncost-T6T-2b]NEC16948.1 hypothetical protein [Streptomyces parvus]PSK71053.1 hypothetical protein C6W96_19445 [Streptomyces sp. CS149]